jgi:transposase
MTARKEEKRPDEATEGEAIPSEEIDLCGLCATLFSKKEAPASCGNEKRGPGGPWRFMTEREFTVLKAMRNLREMAVRIKNRIRKIQKDLETKPQKQTDVAPDPNKEMEAFWEQQMADELLSHCDRLAKLKQEWKEMDQERMAAQEERMRLLGHIQ